MTGDDIPLSVSGRGPDVDDPAETVDLHFPGAIGLELEELFRICRLIDDRFTVNVKGDLIGLGALAQLLIGLQPGLGPERVEVRAGLIHDAHRLQLHDGVFTVIVINDVFLSLIHI